MPDMPKLFEFIRVKFNERADTDPIFAARVSEFNKTIIFCLDDECSYCFSVTGGRVPAIFKADPTTRHDIKIMSNTKDLLALLSGELDPMKARLVRKVRINGGLKDIAWLKRFLELNKSTIGGVLRDFEQA
jgi:putative sterol carrier protein